jgi:hypothetical protein
MNNDEFKWSKKEKEIARKIFDQAHDRELNYIIDKIRKDISNIKISEKYRIWKIHDYLSEKRKEIDFKYDYRYSVLIMVFGRLFEEGFIVENDLTGLSEEKINKIKSIAEFRKRY